MPVTKFSRLNLQKEVLADQFRGFFKKTNSVGDFALREKAREKTRMVVNDTQRKRYSVHYKISLK